MNSEIMEVASYRLCPKAHWLEVSIKKVEAQTEVFAMFQIHMRML